MDRIQLKARKREIKTSVKKLRARGELPAVLYGHNVANQSLTVKQGDFDKVLKAAGESSVIDLVTDDGQIHPVLIHDVQLHYLTNKPLHADFYQVSMTEKVKAKVTLEFVGEAPAVKTKGGVLVKILNEVEVQCLPADLPHNIPVDITPLTDFQNAICVKDLKVSNKVQILTSPEEVVAKVQPPRDVEAELASGPVDEKAAVEAAVAASEKAQIEAQQAAESNATEEKDKSENQKNK